MKAFILVLLAAFLAGSPSDAAHWGGGSHGISGGGRGAVMPSSRSMSFTHNSAVTRSVVSHQAVERVPNHYYYHNEGGSRYWHYYGPGGLHWYGFYYGPNFFWFPFYSGYWWWYDANMARWAYWWDGYWWWNGPGGVPYVYVNDDFIPYDQYEQQAQSAPDQEAVKPPSAPPTAPPSAAVANAPAKEGSAWKSPDGKRMVQIVGPNGGAVLYDEEGSEPVFMKFLAGNVESVRFSGGAGQPLQILLNYKDGRFALFDANGNPVGHSTAPPQ